MGIRFAKDYVDEVFATADFDRIYHLISLVDEEPDFPEELWIFSRIFEWAPARSGVWQYYEALPEEKFLKISASLEKFGFSDVAARFREGYGAWESQNSAEELDRWLDEHSGAIHTALFRLIQPMKNYLIRGS